jgi:hypothetical protein
MVGPFNRHRSERAVRADQRAEARQAEATFRDALTAGRPDLGGGRIKAPPERERVAKRFGGGTRAATGEYDWFYELHPDEQGRIRRNWMTEAAGTGVAPDEVEDMGLPMPEWLALTRGIDAAKAVQSGRHLQARRYGGRHPLAFLVKGDPADHGPPPPGQPTPRIASRRDPSKWHDVDQHARVQYFTANGVIHPIRASYAHADSGRYSAPMSEAERKERYGEDEAF